MDRNLINQAKERLTRTTTEATPKSDQSLQQYRKIVFQVCPNFEITEYNKEIINELYKYVHGYGKLLTNKGILFFGEVGTGKSTLMKILAEYQRTIDRGFKCVNCAGIAAMFSSYGIDSLNESTWNDGHCGANPVERGFDELGREPIPAKYYGNELNVMQHIIQIRYDLKAKTHITTNLRPEEIETKYGQHIYDRCIEIFNFVEIKGESRRK